MVVFNPQVQETQAQDFTRDFKPAGNPGANKSGEILMNTIGSAITDTTGLVDQQIKKDIDSKIYAGVDKQRDDYTQFLEAARNTVHPQDNMPTLSSSTGGGQPTSAGGQALSFADEENTTEVPPAVSAIEGQVNTLTTARNAGKINDTYYTQQLTSLAKSIRTQYPGYREYIDQKMSQASGLQPANAYYKNLMQDINTSLAAKDNPLKQSQALAVDAQKKGWTGADVMAGALNSGYVTPDRFNAWYQFNAAKEAAHRAREESVKEAGWDREDTKIKVRSNLSQSANDIVAQVANTTLTLANGKTQTIDQFMQSVAQETAAGHPIDQQVVAQAATAMESAKQQAIRQIRAKNPNAATVLGDKEVNDQIEAVTSYFDTGIKQIYNKDTGSFYSNAQQVKAITDSTTNSLLNYKGVGPYMRAMGAISNLAPQAGPVLFQQAMGAGLTGEMATWLKDTQAGMLANPNASLAGDLKRSKAYSDSLGNPASAAKMYREVIKLPTIIGSKDPRVTDDLKLKAAQYAFGPDNINSLDLLNKDTKVNGVDVPGKYAAYSILGSPQVSESMWKLRNGTPEGNVAWGNYRMWMENSFTKLFRSDIASLSEIANNTGIHIAYDSEGRFIPTDSKGRSLSRAVPEMRNAVPSDIEEANRIINRLNGGLASLKEVMKRDNTDVSSYLASQLMNSGLNPEGKITGLPKQLLDNIAAAKLRAGVMNPKDNFFQQK